MLEKPSKTDDILYVADDKNSQKKPANPLEKDLAAYEEKKADLQAQAGKFVLFFEGELIGTYDTAQEAYAKGYEKAKVKPFLVTQISPVPTIQHFTRAIKFQCLTST